MVMAFNQLIQYLTSEYVGHQFLWLVQQLQEQHAVTLEELVDKEEKTFQEICDSIKYLLKSNIVTIQKHAQTVCYKLVNENLLYYQRLGKFSKYIERLFEKQEIVLITYFLTNQATSVEECIKQVVHKKSEEERYKLISIELIKKNILFEDQKAYDFKVCANYIEPQQQSKTQIVTTNKSKKKTKIEEVSVIDLKSIEKHDYNVSKQGLLEHIKDYLLAERIIQKYGLTKSHRQAIVMINSQKYTGVLEHFNTGDKSPKFNLQESIKRQIIQDLFIENFSHNALSVYNTLKQKNYIDEKQLMQLTLMDLKVLRQCMNPLIQSGLIKYIELKVQKTPTTMFSVNPNDMYNFVLNRLSKAIMNMHILSKKLQHDYYKEVQKGVNTVDSEKILKVETSLSRLDDLLILIT